MASDIKLTGDDVVIEGTLRAGDSHCKDLVAENLRVNGTASIAGGLQTPVLQTKQFTSDAILATSLKVKGAITADKGIQAGNVATQGLDARDIVADTLKTRGHISADGGLQTSEIRAKRLDADDIVTGKLQVNGHISALKGLQTEDISTNGLVVSKKAKLQIVESAGIQTEDLKALTISTGKLKVDEFIEANGGIQTSDISVEKLTAMGAQVKNILTTQRLRITADMQLGGKLTLPQHNSTDLIELVFKMKQQIESLEKKVAQLSGKP